MRNMVLIFFLAFMLGGCATMRQSNKKEIAIEELKARMSELQKELEQKDEQIWALQREIENTHQQAISAALPVTSVKKTTAGLSSKQIQVALKKAGFYTGAVDGKIGKATKQAIINFQKANDLVADGIVGKKTIEKLKRYL